VVGIELPNELISIIEKYGGLAVLEDKYIDSNNNEWELQTFDHIASIIDLTKEFKEKGWGLKVPFAYDPGGWHFCLTEEQFLVIANSFEEFIDGLKRSDEESIQNFVFKLKFTHLFFRFNSFFKVNKKLVVNLSPTTTGFFPFFLYL